MSNLSFDEFPQSKDYVTKGKVLFLTNYFPPDYAATGQLIDELTKTLSDQGLEIRVFTGQPGYAFEKADAPRRETIEEVEIRRTRASQIWPQRIRGKAVNGITFFVRAALHMLRHPRGQKLVVTTTAPPFLPLLGYLGYLFLRLPYIVIIYDLYPDIAVALRVVSPRNPLIKLWQTVNRQVWRKAKNIIVLTPAMKQSIIDACPDVAEKIVVIHNWADGDSIVPQPKLDNWFAQKYGLVDKFTVLYSGNMGRCHDMMTIIQAAQYLQDQPIQFVLIGDGAQYDTLCQETKRLGLTNIFFLPYQDKEVLPYSLTACDLSLISIAEGMEKLVAPSKLYSTLAAGRPVAAICSQQSFLRDIVREAKCGESFDNGDGYALAQFISQLDAQPEIAESMGKAARQYFSTHFTREICCNQYLEVLQKALWRRRR